MHTAISQQCRVQGGLIRAHWGFNARRSGDKSTHRPLEDPEGVGADSGGKVGGTVQAMQGKVLAPNEGVSSHVTISVGLVAKGKGETEQVETQRRRAGVDQNQHRDMAGETGAHTPNGDLRRTMGQPSVTFCICTVPQPISQDLHA